MSPQLRVARPTDNLEAIAEMYSSGLGFQRLGSFEDHEGFDGVILGTPGGDYHLEFTSKKRHTVGNAPTKDNLLIFFLPDPEEWRRRCEQMSRAGFRQVQSFNPYWDHNGSTFEDLDGYRVVLQNSTWRT